MDFAKKSRSLSDGSKSVFVSYARGEDKNERFIDLLLQWLQKSGYEVISCDCAENEWSEMMKSAVKCQNVVLVSTEKYAYTCLMGHVKSSKSYAKFPSFAIPAKTDSLEPSMADFEYAFKVAATVYGMIGDERMPADRIQLLCELLTHEKSEVAAVRYYFSDDYCLEENQLIVRNESLFARIVTLFRSGGNCICRYPIIDCSQDSDIDNSFSELSLYLKSEPSQRLKNLERPQILRVVSGLRKGKKGETLLDDVKFWRLSERHVYAMVPSLYRGEFKGTANTINRDWKPLRR